MEPCWQCGAPWRCRRCGSHEQRPGNKGCAECHRRAARKQKPSHPGLTIAESALFTHLLLDDFADVEVTVSVGHYLAAFDKYLKARSDGDHRSHRAAKAQRRGALGVLESPVTPAPGGQP